MARTRQQRRNDFVEFFNSAVNIFIEFRDNDPKAEKFERLYMLNVCPGSRLGGNNNRVVEVFWGSRAFDTITLGNSWKSLTEYGATLLYELDDSGFVMISLYPAGTENRKPIESSITLKLWIDPIKLLDKSFLKKNWKDFMSYMECTSLDGTPNFVQRQRISLLRTFKHLVIDNSWSPTRFFLFLRGVFKLILAAIFSGAVLIYLITILSKPTTKETNILLHELNKNLENISTKLDKIPDNNLKSNTLNMDSVSSQLDKLSDCLTIVKTLEVSTDSIISVTKEIIGSINKHKLK